MINFSPVCVNPMGSAKGFMRSPDVRSTLDIVWSCLSIIILSTWSILHLNVPVHYKSKTKRQYVQKQIYLISRKLMWMTVFLMVPEWYMNVAYNKMHVAKLNRKRLKDFAKIDEADWSLRHTYLADMGGIAIRFPHDTGFPVIPDMVQEGSGQLVQPSMKPEKHSSNNQQASPQNTQLQPKKSTNTMDSLALPSATEIDYRGKDVQFDEKFIQTVGPGETHEDPPDLEAGVNKDDFFQRFAAKQKKHADRYGKNAWELHEHNMKLASKIVDEKDDTELASLCGNIWLLGSSQLLIAREKGIIRKMPQIEQDAIGNSSTLIKLLALLQIIWLIAQLITRRINHLPFAPLEINAVAFAASAFITYIIEFRKPQNVAVPFTIDADALPNQEVFNMIFEKSANKYDIGAWRYTIPTSTILDVPDGEGTDDDNKETGGDKKETGGMKKWRDWIQINGLKLASYLVLWGSFALFGGIHFFAWDVSFPTPIEKTLWRISAIITTVLPVPSFIAFILDKLDRAMFGEKKAHLEFKPRVYLFTFIAIFVVLITLALSLCYIAARLFIMVESFRSLYYLAPETYKSTWAANMPHVS